MCAPLGMWLRARHLPARAHTAQAASRVRAFVCATRESERKMDNGRARGMQSLSVLSHVFVCAT